VANEPDEVRTFGGLLREWRIAAGFTQEQLAERSGLGIRTIRELERGRVRRPHRESVGLLSTALGLPPAARDDLIRAAHQRPVLPPPAAAAASVAVPRQLPPAVRHFAGRADALNTPTEAIGAAAAPGGTAVISVIDGNARISKTARAVPEVRFGLLGPVLAMSAGSAVAIRASRQRTLLAALLLRANRAVAAEELADQVWDGAPPAGAATTLRSYVMRLRRALGPDAGRRLQTRPPGYLIEVTADSELDLWLFAALRRQAQDAAAAQDWDGAAAGLEAALGLWRGSALEDVPEIYLKARELPALREGWIQAHEALARADLELGRPGEVLERVARLQAQFPYREGLSELVMRARVAAGRPAEALDEYARLRRALVRDLGVEPGSRSRALQAAILGGRALPSWPRDRPSARLAASPADALVPSRPVPRQLPGAVRHFAGRAAEMRALTGLADSALTGKTVIAAISGMAGAGKTALSVHWAHQAAHRFPDGQLYLNLRGFDSSAVAVTPAEAVRACLDAFGVAAAQLPVGPEAQAALYRSLLAGKRMLVLLDNARDDEHARPLLPGSPACLVMVTSRAQLTGLAATEGAHLLTLGPLTRAETRELLAGHLGAARMAAEPAAVDAMITQSAGLALGASILAARAAASPGHPLTAGVAQLRDARERLDAMQTGDAAADLRTVFSWSGRHLSPQSARVFRLLGLHPGPGFALPAVASMTGLPLREARAAMNELVRAHLVTEHAAGRFAFHDLLRAYAAELAGTAESAIARRTAMHRVLDHYLRTARNGAGALGRPAQAGEMRLVPARPGVTAEKFTSSDAALQWFSAHYPVLAAVVAWSAETGFDSHCCQLSWSLMAFLDQGARWQAMAEIHQTALRAARRLNDRFAEGLAHRALGYARGRTGSHQAACAHFREATEIFQSTGDAGDCAVSHRGLAWVLGLCGRHDEAMIHAQHAVSLTRSSHPGPDHAHALNMAGRCHAYLGAYQHAVISCSQALALHQQEANAMGEAEAWYSLGLAHQHAGRHADSITSYEQALSLFQELGDRHYIGETLTGLGDTHGALGHHATAVTLWQRALSILVDIHHPDAGRVRAQLRETVPAPS
jgi:DNA-binding SARP family transcriptional activator/tetratricopeptide (TPR) repeat protein/transcriptional regulator with XRE-family HTH domain